MIERNSRAKLAISLLAILLFDGCSAFLHREIDIPQPGLWAYQGQILSDGSAGSWDDRIFPGIDSPSTATTNGSEVAFYYIGADGDRASDGGPAHRAIGLATSSGGTEYKKYFGNPVITYAPTPKGCNEVEEGIWHASAALHGGNDTVIYYAGLKQTGCTAVQSDILLSTSLDGRTFNDHGVVLSATDSSVWGTGRKGAEIFPTAAYEHNDTWYLFYVSKEVSPEYSLGLASGLSKDNFTNTQSLLFSGDTSLGPGTMIRSGSVWELDSNTYTLILQISNKEQGKARLEARIFDPSDPASLSGPVTVFDWDSVDPGNMSSLVMLDEANGYWLLYAIRDNTAITLFTAPVESNSGNNPSTIRLSP